MHELLAKIHAPIDSGCAAWKMLDDQLLSTVWQEYGDSNEEAFQQEAATGEVLMSAPSIDSLSACHCEWRGHVESRGLALHCVWLSVAVASRANAQDKMRESICIMKCMMSNLQV